MPDQEKAKLEKDKIKLEIEKLRIDNLNDERNLKSGRGLLNFVFINLSVLVGVVFGITGLYKYLKERSEELRKREDERFQRIVDNLGGELESQRLGAALLLPTFLQPDYRRFYAQVFNLAAGNLRLSLSVPSQMSFPRGGISAMQSALVKAFVDAYPIAKELLREEGGGAIDRKIGRSLNATGVRLDNSFLAGVDLSGAWLRDSSLQGTELDSANFTSAVLEKANFEGASLDLAQLSNANLRSANFTRAKLTNAVMTDSNGEYAVFKLANMKKFNVAGGRLGGADFAGADLSEATFVSVSFSTVEGIVAQLASAASLKGAIFTKSRGLSKEQIDLCKAKGAEFID